MRLVPAALLSVCSIACDKPAPELPSARPPETSAAASAPAPSLTQVSHRPRCMRALPPTPEPEPRYRVDPGCPTDPAGGPPMVPVGHISFPEARDAPKLEVELMLDDKTRERGMMYRKSLADDRGMLFVFMPPSFHTFWMHNTCIPLDMLFIDQEGYVAGIVENAPTLNDQGRTVPCEASYVLEVNGGWSRKHGVSPGQRLRIEGVPAR